MERTELKKYLPYVFIGTFYVFGTIGHLIGSLSSIVIPLTPYVLIGIGMPVFIYTVWGSWKLTVFSAVVYVLTFTIEALGVHTGHIFGAYTYGPTLGFKLFAVPLVIGFNWVLVVLGIVSFFSRYIKSITLLSIASGAAAVVYDLPLEITAMKLDYWQWHIDHVPVQNYIAWFIIVLITVLIMKLLKLTVKNRLLEFYIAVQFIFFIINSI